MCQASHCLVVCNVRDGGSAFLNLHTCRSAHCYIRIGGPIIAAALLLMLWMGFRSLLPEHKQGVVNTVLVNMVTRDLLPYIPKIQFTHFKTARNVCSTNLLPFGLILKGSFDMTTTLFHTRSF